MLHIDETKKNKFMALYKLIEALLVVQIGQLERKFR